MLIILGTEFRKLIEEEGLEQEVGEEGGEEEDCSAVLDWWLRVVSVFAGYDEGGDLEDDDWYFACDGTS